MSRAVNWLIGALAAVAAAMIAGSQLSSIGRLSWGVDRDRLVVALVSIVVAIGLILVSIGLLYLAQTPSNTDLSRLRRLAGEPHPQGLAADVTSQVAEDSSLNRGTGSLAALLRDLDAVRTHYYRLSTEKHSIDLALSRQSDPVQDLRIERRRMQLVREISVVNERMTELRTGMLRVAQLDKFLRTKARYRVSSWAVLVLSVVAAFAFVAFAWAANPADRATDALKQRSVAATMTLSMSGQKSLGHQLGPDCAAAAGTAGVPVIALTSTGVDVEVVMVPTRLCPQPERFTLHESEGRVVADKAAIR